MLEIKNIKKQYITGELVQTALDGVSLTLRENEFVAILGPSGSGKTTLLNIIGGLDRYDSGDLVINGISTKEYTDRDWDTYRNHSIGFIFQSYNLIPHQSVLANVELALTISGISRAERRERARRALEEVGLGDQLHKRPNQMSGGQMQRVAIARALVNDPDILLADEPTGALDTETGIQVMELLKKVAKNKLVVMVTHNPELAEEYANRIVRLRDGRIVSDTNPYLPSGEEGKKAEKPKKKASMSFRTALGLSFNNLMTKKGRTILTSFAGSIGIIGIALILALSTGVDLYIDDLQRGTMASYPITISSQTMDLTGMMMGTDSIFGQVMGSAGTIHREHNGVYTDSSALKLVNAVTQSVVKNDLTAFKEYLEDPNSEIAKYIGENGVIYSYDTKFDVFVKGEKGTYLNTSRDVIEGSSSDMVDYVQNQNQMMASMFGGASSRPQNFSEMLPGKNGEIISHIVTDSYEVVEGRFPEKHNEVILVLSGRNSVETSALFQLGLISEEEYQNITAKIEDKEDFSELTLKYEDIIGKKFRLLSYSDYYVLNEETGLYENKSEKVFELQNIIENGLELEIVGVVRPTEDQATAITTAIAYTSLLTDYIIDHTAESAVVKAQEATPDQNVLTGRTFEDPTSAEKANVTKAFLSALPTEEKANFMIQLMYVGGQMDPAVLALPKEQVAMMLDAWLVSEEATEDVLGKIYDEYISGGTYEENLLAFGSVNYDAPSSISIYCDSFEAKEGVAASIENYNQLVDEEEKITYTDYVAMLTSTITTIVDVISYVLIAFVAVSLVVSCIMIAIITHISVLERTKEIGILRAIGASKGNISQVFNAETFIIGLCSGTIGVTVSALLTIPINAIIHALTGNMDVNAVLPIEAALILIVVSMVITVFGGLIPSKNAANKDPVIALRSE